MKIDKKKTIRNGALVCGGAILLGVSYVIGVKKGIRLGTYGLSDLIVKNKNRRFKNV